MAAKSGKDSSQERKARLAAALRANLHRRKAQTGTRRDSERDDSQPLENEDEAR